MLDCLVIIKRTKLRHARHWENRAAEHAAYSVLLRQVNVNYCCLSQRGIAVLGTRICEYWKLPCADSIYAIRLSWLSPWRCQRRNQGLMSYWIRRLPVSCLGELKQISNSWHWHHTRGGTSHYATWGKRESAVLPALPPLPCCPPPAGITSVLLLPPLVEKLCWQWCWFMARCLWNLTRSLALHELSGDFSEIPLLPGPLLCLWWRQWHGRGTPWHSLWAFHCPRQLLHPASWVGSLGQECPLPIWLLFTHCVFTATNSSVPRKPCQVLKECWLQGAKAADCQHRLPESRRRKTCHFTVPWQNSHMVLGLSLYPY